MRARGRLLPALLALALVLPSAGDAAARRFEDLPRAFGRDLVRALRDYLDPDLQSVWRPLQTVEGLLQTGREGGDVDVLRDVELLEDLVHQGRTFRTPFTDRGWQRDESARVIEERIGRHVALHVKAEGLDLTLLLPRDHEREVRRLDDIPRPAPRPLLVTLHDRGDAREARPGLAALQRRWLAKGSARGVAEWLLLAPVAEDGIFTDADGAVRHGRLTVPLREVFTRHHVDFARIVLDGAKDALWIAAAQPWLYAGLVLRGGEVGDVPVGNLASVPVFVRGEARLKDALQAAGHPYVTHGDDDDLAAWLAGRRREVPRELSWSRRVADHELAHWVQIHALLPDARGGQLGVRVVPGTDGDGIEIDTAGVERLSLFLNDRIADLDRPLTVTWNGVRVHEGVVTRSVRTLFEQPPGVRKSQVYAWLYPARLPEDGTSFVVPDGGRTAPRPPIDAEASRALELLEEAEDLEAAGDLLGALEVLGKALALGRTPSEGRILARIAAVEQALRPLRVSPERRLDAERLWLLGRLDLLEEALEGATTPEDRFPLALRDHFWRRGATLERRTRTLEDVEGAEGLTRRRYLWLLQGGVDGGPEGPYPEAEAGEEDPWPVLTRLVVERIRREEAGPEGLPEESPLMAVPEAWADWYPAWRDFFLSSVMANAYQGLTPERMRPDERERLLAQRERVRALASRNDLLAALAVLAFLALAGLGAWRTGAPR